jgi:GTPase SAR1 family protein
LGDAGVGKTAIVKSLIGHPHSFPSKYTMTPGVEIFVKSIRSSSIDSILEFFIYDFSGKPIYADLVRQLWSNNVSIIVGVFDVNREDSFFSLQSQLTELLKQFDNPDEVIGIILGNKTDLTGRRSVSAEEAHQLAKKYKMRYFDVSAKESRSQIEEAFLYLTNLWFETHKKHYSPRPSVTFKTDPPSQSQMRQQQAA